jgi:hypothetical protein
MRRQHHTETSYGLARRQEFGDPRYQLFLSPELALAGWRTITEQQRSALSTILTFQVQELTEDANFSPTAHAIIDPAFRLNFNHSILPPCICMAAGCLC